MLFNISEIEKKPLSNLSEQELRILEDYLKQRLQQIKLLLEKIKRDKVFYHSF